MTKFSEKCIRSQLIKKGDLILKMTERKKLTPFKTGSMRDQALRSQRVGSSGFSQEKKHQSTRIRDKDSIRRWQITVGSAELEGGNIRPVDLENKLQFSSTTRRNGIREIVFN